MDIHTLAIQMGTSIAMIERHYSHLTPRLRKEMLTGKRYELSKEEFQEKVLEWTTRSMLHQNTKTVSQSHQMR